MSKGRKKLLTYEELLEKFPDFIFWDAFNVFEEKTPELTQQARMGKKTRTGYLLKFLQDNNLTRRIICATAPDIPDDLVIYFRDLVPESVDWARLALEKWYARFDRNGDADPSDVRILEKYLKQLREQSKP